MRKKLETVVDGTVVIPGKFYLVPFAVLQNSEGIERYALPVIGPAHQDNDFAPGVGRHYHIDGRFVTQKIAKHIYSPFVETGRTAAVVFAPKAGDETFGVHRVCRIEYRKVRAAREFTGLRIPADLKEDERYVRWYSAQIGKSCAGKRCPHLGQTMLERNGKWVCPLHNLTGDPGTEKIVPFYDSVRD